MRSVRADLGRILIPEGIERGLAIINGVGFEIDERPDALAQIQEIDHASL